MNKFETAKIEYNIFKDETLNKLMYRGLNKSPYDFAVILHYLCKKKYKCTKNGAWYTFIGHKWRINDTNIYDAISTDIVNNYKKMKRFYINIQNKNNQFISDKFDVLSSILNKQFFMKTFGIINSKNKVEFKNFYKKYYNMEISFRRFEKIFQFKTNRDDNENDNFNDGNDESRHEIIFEILDFLTEQNKKYYTYDELIGVTIGNNQYVNAINNISNDSIYFKNEEINRALFFKTKGNLKPLHEQNMMHYVKTIQSLLAMYCINLNISKRVSIKGTRKYIYLLSIDKQIKNMIEFKYCDIDNIEEFKTLFKNK